ncbi:hypothetical protein Tco_1537628 [Tanacetum coccineum]
MHIRSLRFILASDHDHDHGHSLKETDTSSHKHPSCGIHVPIGMIPIHIPNTIKRALYKLYDSRPRIGSWGFCHQRNLQQPTTSHPSAIKIWEQL